MVSRPTRAAPSPMRRLMVPSGPKNTAPSDGSEKTNSHRKQNVNLRTEPQYTLKTVEDALDRERLQHLGWRRRAFSREDLRNGARQRAHVANRDELTELAVSENLAWSAFTIGRDDRSADREAFNEHRRQTLPVRRQDEYAGARHARVGIVEKPRHRHRVLQSSRTNQRFERRSFGPFAEDHQP